MLVDRIENKNLEFKRIVELVFLQLDINGAYRVKILAMSQCEDPKPEPVEEKNSDDLCEKKCNEETDDSDPCGDPDFGGGDPQEKYRELCRRTKECKGYLKKLNECNERVNSKTKTEEKCVEEVIDYFHCVDHCAAKRFFKLLK